MAIISNVRNDGKGFVKVGPKKANSYNVSPVNFVATASPGTALTIVDVANYDFFNAAQTSAGTDLIILDSGLEVGTELYLFCVSACKVGCTASSGIGINGGTDSQVITLVANSTYRLFKVNSTNFICEALTLAGVRSVPSAA
jgi:hypothetical protein